MRKLLVASLLALPALAVANVPAGAADGDPQGDPMDAEVACPAEDLPHTFSPLLTAEPDDGSDISYDIAVLLDGVSQAQVEDLFERSQPAYDAHGITLRAVSFAQVSLPAGTTADSTDTIDFARDHFGGARPAGSDAVYLATSKDLTDEALGNAVAGQVACVGGVEDAATAFAVGEVKPESAIELGPVGLFADISLKVFAHELGHLLGAHHHYGNCVEGLGLDDIEGDTAPCTLMFNVADFQSMGFSTFNGGVIRGHANDHARP